MHQCIIQEKSRSDPRLAALSTPTHTDKLIFRELLRQVDLIRRGFETHNLLEKGYGILTEFFTFLFSL
jgi:hypothetical protein